MASQEDLRKAHPTTVNLNRFGHNFNPRPQPDAFGRTPATPVEVQRAMRGEFILPPAESHQDPKRRVKGVIPNYELLRRERQQRAQEERKRRSRGNGRHQKSA